MPEKPLVQMYRSMNSFPGIHPLRERSKIPLTPLRYAQDRLLYISVRSVRYPGYSTGCEKDEQDPVSQLVMTFYDFV